LIASGSEVELALKSAEKLAEEKIAVRVISFPSWELFEAQTEEYKASVLPKSVKARVAIEAGVKLGWEKYAGDTGEVISIEKFGASAPDKILFENYGFTVENVISTSRRVLSKVK
jgi:transketolase